MIFSSLFWKSEGNSHNLYYYSFRAYRNAWVKHIRTPFSSLNPFFPRTIMCRLYLQSPWYISLPRPSKNPQRMVQVLNSWAKTPSLWLQTEGQTWAQDLRRTSPRMIFMLRLPWFWCVPAGKCRKIWSNLFSTSSNCWHLQTGPVGATKRTKPPGPTWRPHWRPHKFNWKHNEWTIDSWWFFFGILGIYIWLKHTKRG